MPKTVTAVMPGSQATSSAEGDVRPLAAVSTAAAPSVPVRAAGKSRNVALDFTKGVLVLFMVLYHWLNYFVNVGPEVYRYLRFITPSFIFITGFLVSHVYLAKYELSDARLPKRLFERGLKLLAVFTLLNLAAGFVSRDGSGQVLGLQEFIGSLVSIYVTADSVSAAFQVLVPISYVLMLSAGVLVVRRHLTFSVYLACAGIFAALLVLDVSGIVVANLELIGVGFLGVYIGSFPSEKFDFMARYVPVLLLAYVAYCGALAMWDVVYPLQVAGVCLSLLLIYILGMKWRGDGWFLSRVYMLGRYTLWAYVAQIALLQILQRLLNPMGNEVARLAVSCVAAFVLTQISVEVVEFGRAKSKKIDALYRLVFA